MEETSSMQFIVLGKRPLDVSVEEKDIKKQKVLYDEDRKSKSASIIQKWVKGRLMLKRARNLLKKYRGNQTEEDNERESFVPSAFTDIELIFGNAGIKGMTADQVTIKDDTSSTESKEEPKQKSEVEKIEEKGERKPNEVETQTSTVETPRLSIDSLKEIEQNEVLDDKNHENQSVIFDNADIQLQQKDIVEKLSEDDKKDFAIQNDPQMTRDSEKEIVENQQEVTKGTEEKSEDKEETAKKRTKSYFPFSHSGAKIQKREEVPSKSRKFCYEAQPIRTKFGKEKKKETEEEELEKQLAIIKTFKNHPACFKPFVSPRRTITTEMSNSTQPKEVPKFKNNILTKEQQEQVEKLKLEIEKLDEELDDLKRQKEEKELEVKEYMDKLHKYNEIKDIAQMLMAQIEGATTKEMYTKFGLSLED